MSTIICQGKGQCLQQCVCTCEQDENTMRYFKTCICGHGNHATIVGGYSYLDEYCQEIPCEFGCWLVKCHNFTMCGQSRPQWILDRNGGMCLDCAVNYGPMKFMNVKDDCAICLELKDVVQINCGNHVVCIDCWKQWCHTSKSPAKCHLCREPIWK